MTTWDELNERFNNLLDESCEKSEEFNATLCNEKAHEAIAAREKNMVKELIVSAAKSGCFRTILPRCHSDTMKWLEDLDFKVYYQGQTEVSWED